MDEVVIPHREVIPSRYIMLVFSLLCVAIASSLLITEIFGAEDEEYLMFGPDDQFRVSELGSTREENLNCFLQFDQSMADKWTSELGLGGNSNSDESLFVMNRFKDENLSETHQLLSVDTRIMFEELGTCMNNLTKKIKNPGLQKCMKDLVHSEIENDAYISLPQLFDDSLPLPFLTFLDIREVAKVLYQNRTWDELGRDEKNVFQIASDYLKKYKSGIDKVFVFDQYCEWKNLAALKNVEENVEETLEEFKQQVIRSISLQIAHEVFSKGDLKPGTWITVYRRWGPVRLQNLKELESLLDDLKTQRFTTEELCRYATTLGKFFAEQELKILLPEKISPLRLLTTDLKAKSISKEGRLCSAKTTRECEIFKISKKSYEEDLSCIETFGKLLSNHILYSIIEKFSNIEPRITYPEIVCKKNSSPDKVSIRYCRCIGSFCTFHEVGDINANSYKLINDVVTRV